MFYKLVDGVKVYATNRVVIGDRVCFNPTKEQLLEAGFVEEEAVKPSAEELLKRAKELKLAEIAEYDAGEAVNSFSLDGMPLWLTQDVRLSVMNSTNVRKALGLKETTLWVKGVKLVLPCDVAIGLLCQLEDYALSCFDVTEGHKAAVRKLKTVDEVSAYDYKKGYPAKLELKTH